MATQAAHVRRKEGDKGEKLSESKETTDSVPTKQQQRTSRTKPPQNNSLKGKVKKNEGSFLIDNENFNETGALSSVSESVSVDFISQALNKAADEISVQPVISQSIVDNTLPAINSGGFLPVTLPAGNNVVDITSHAYNPSFISTVDNSVVLTTNIGSADSSKGVLSYSNFTTLNTQEAVSQYNNTAIPQEITRVTLSSVHKVEGNKDLTPIKAMSTSYIQNYITSENIIEKNISHADTSVFDVPTTQINVDKLPNKTDEMIIKTNPMINAGLQIEDENQLNNERARSFACEGSSSNTHLVNVAGPSEISSKSFSNPQPLTENRSSTKGSGRGRPKKAVTKSNNEASTAPKPGRGRPRKVKPSETLAGTAEEITTEIKPAGNESFTNTHESLPEVQGSSVIVADENITKTNPGKKRGRPPKITQVGNSVTGLADGSTSKPIIVPKKRGRPRKEAANNGELNANPMESTILIKTGKRGRPRKVPKVDSHLSKDSIVPTKHKGRGRPRKVYKPGEAKNESTGVVKKRGRPRKVLVSENSEPKISESNEPKDVPESIEHKDTSENIMSKDVSENIEPNETTQSIDPKDAPENSGLNDKPVDATIDVKIKTGKRGRPKKTSTVEGNQEGSIKEPTVPKKRGRPKKEKSENNETKPEKVKGKRGRPKKKQKVDEPSAGSDEPGAALESVESQPAISNIQVNATTVSVVNVDGVNMTTGEIPTGGTDEIPEESIDELIDELTTATN
ncbi:14231_t:CDS:2 [Acaulospora morrowiae]|uniref:14231_t:CDS:1 n=1 Tax=Acaulospora morrowiae TaxID=94023 RepID=A0A9N9G8Y4_9GLOM|nr:14231_t:CDS:2 [Acaulospora morrowiae]